MSDNFVPGVMRCAKCNFVLHRVTLHVSSRSVSAGDSKTEPCPNGCGPLWPMTWRQQAEELQERCEEQLARAVDLEAGFDVNMERVKACEHIAEGEDGWQTLRNLCPSTAAVASLRDHFEVYAKALQEIANYRLVSTADYNAFKMGEVARCKDPTNYENIEDATKRILDLGALYDNDLEIRAKIAEAVINKYVLTSAMLQPGPFKPPLFHSQYEEAVEAVARAIYNVELARGDHASSVLIDMMVGRPGSKATREGIRETCRIEPYEENPESWREYAVSAIAAFLAHRHPASTAKEADPNAH